MKYLYTKQFIFLAVLIFTFTALEASSDTLPQNIWRATVRSDSRTFTQIGGQTFANDGSPNGDFQFYNVRDYSAKNIEAFQPLIQGGLVSENIKLVDSGFETNYYVDLAYGITNSLSVGISVPYRIRVVNYSDEYVQKFTEINQAAANGFIPGVSDEDITVPPKTARGEGIGDITAGLRYKVLDHFSLQVTAKAGFLKTGKDYAEISKKSDGHEELVTGISGDEYTLEAYYDSTTSPVKVECFGIYTIYTPGRATGLDNDFDTVKGNTFQLGANSVIPLSDKFDLRLGGYYFVGGSSQIKENGSWSEIQHSDIQFLAGRASITYRPTIFSEVWFGLERPLYNKPTGGLYDYPGRLNTDLVIDLGVNIFM